MLIGPHVVASIFCRDYAQHTRPDSSLFQGGSTTDCADFGGVTSGAAVWLWDPRSRPCESSGLVNDRGGLKELQVSLKDSIASDERFEKGTAAGHRHAVRALAFRAHDQPRLSTVGDRNRGSDRAQSRNNAACPCVAPSTTTIHTTAPEMRKRVPSFAIRTPW